MLDETRILGKQYVRALRSAIISKGDEAVAIAHHAHHFGMESRSEAVIKAAVGSMSTTAAIADAARLASDAFLAGVKPRTILGRLQGLRSAPPGVEIPLTTEGSTTYWVGEGKAKPLTRMAVTRAALPPRKVAGIMVLSMELVRATDKRALSIFQTDLEDSVRRLEDSSFINPDNAGVGSVQPPSVTNGAPTIASSGTIATDIKEALDLFTGNLDTATWVMHPRTAVGIGLAADGLGADLGARGGVLAGLPVLTSDAVPRDGSPGTSPITLLDAAGIVVVDEGILVKVSTATTLEMQGEPTSDSTTPAATSQVSLWQTNSAAVMAERNINWLVGREGAVVVIDNAAY